MKVKELLASPSAWTQGSYARDKDGYHTFIDNPQAYCFCLGGAVIRCYKDPYECDEAYRKLLEAIKKRTGLEVSLLFVFNDDPKTTHADILAVAEAADV